MKFLSALLLSLIGIWGFLQSAHADHDIAIIDSIAHVFETHIDSAHLENSVSGNCECREKSCGSFDEQIAGISPRSPHVDGDACALTALLTPYDIPSQSLYDHYPTATDPPDRTSYTAHTGESVKLLL